MIQVDHYRVSWSGTSTDVPITPIQATNRAFIVVSGSSNLTGQSDAPEWAHGARFVDTSTVRLTRAVSTGSDAESSFFVVWCDALEFRTEHVAASISPPDTDKAVALEDGTYALERTHVVLSSFAALTSTSVNRLACVTAEMDSPSFVRFRRGRDGETVPALSGVTSPSAFVVEWDVASGVSVATGEDDLSGDLSTTKTFAQPTPEHERTLVFWQFRHGSSGLEQTSIEAWLDENGRHYRRYDTTNSHETKARWWAVTFPENSGVVVARSSAEAAGPDQETIVPYGQGIIGAQGLFTLHTNSCNGAGTGSARERWVTDSIGLDSATLRRWRTGQAARHRIQAAELGAFIPPGGHFEDEIADEGKDVVAKDRQIVRLVVPNWPEFFELFIGEEQETAV